MQMAHEANRQSEMMNSMHHRYHPQAITGGDNHGFNAGAMTGGIAGVASVLGAYFIIKMFTRKSNESDDFERI